MLSFCNLQSQEHDFNISISKLTTNEGLSQGSNYFRFEDSLGYMWITGNDAVNRYDGSRVKIFNLNKYFYRCPNLQQGYGFVEDDRSNIYIGSVNGLYIYNRNRDIFTLQKIYEGTDQTAMPIGFKDGKIWCFNKKFDIVCLDIKSKKIENICKLPLTAMKSIHIYDMASNIFYFRFPLLVNNTIWFVDSNEVLYIKMNDRTINFPLKSALENENLKFYSSCYDPISNSIFIGSDNRIIKHSIDIKQTTITTLKRIKNQNFPFITSIAVNKDVIAFTQNSDLFVCNTTFGNVQNLKTYFTDANPSFQLNFDKNNRLWMCKDGLGQYILNFKPPLLNKETCENTKLKSLLKFGVIGFAELPNNEIIINDNIVKLPENNGYQSLNQFKKIAGFRSTTDNYRKGIWQYATLLDKSTNIYFLNKNKQETLYATFETKLNLGLIQDLQVLDNNLILCSFQTGLYWFNLKTKKMEKLANQVQTNCFKINKLSNNRIAVSFLENDMQLIKINKNKTLTFIKQILVKQQSFYMQENKSKKQFWVGTNNGVYLLNKNFKTIRKFDANDGMAGTYIYGLLIDNQGNAWCSHQRGLSSIDAKSFQIINYNKSDGIQDWDFNNRAFYKATDGTLYFGGVKGFNYFKPPLIRKTFYKPKIYIDEILVNSVAFKTQSWVNMLKKIDLKSDENNLSFYVVINDIDDAASQNILYRINNGKWNTIKNPNYINFSSLAPDCYILQLATHDKFTNKIIVHKSITVNIENPFYLTIWFWSLITFGISTIIYFYFNTRKLDRQKVIFQQRLALEQQRNKITADLHDDIGATLSSLQLNSAIANQLIKKDITKTTDLLEKIENQSKDLADKIGDIIWSMKPGKNEFMTMSSRIKNFVNDILGSTNINYIITIDENLDERITDIDARKNIILFIKEATNNVAKYSKAINFELGINLIDNEIIIKMKDDGVGFKVDETHGNGIGNMSKRIEELKGQFFITSEIKKGTTIQATISIVT